MKWFKKRKRIEDDFDRKYGDLYKEQSKYFPIEAAGEEKASLAQEPLFTHTKEQRKQFVENHCEKISEATKKMEETKKEYQMVNEYLSDIQRIESLPDESRNKVTGLAKKVMVLEKDRKDFASSMSKMSSVQFNQMKECGDNIKNILKDLQENEQYCQKVRQDINMLEGEKNALRYEKKAMNEKIYLVRGASKIAITAFSALILLLLFIQMKSGKDVSLFMYLFIGCALVAVFVLFWMHNYAIRSLKNIEYKMNHTIGLLNKVKLRYVNVEARIEYVYQRFGIHTSYELNKIWGNYLQTIKEQEVYHKASNKLYEAEEDLVEELKKYHLHDADVWVQQVDALLSQKEMDHIKKELHARRKRLQSTIEYNNDVIESSGQAIKKLVEEYPDHAQEILGWVENMS